MYIICIHMYKYGFLTLEWREGVRRHTQVHTANQGIPGRPCGRGMGGMGGTARPANEARPGRRRFCPGCQLRGCIP